MSIKVNINRVNLIGELPSDLNLKFKWVQDNDVINLNISDFECFKEIWLSFINDLKNMAKNKITGEIELYDDDGNWTCLMINKFGVSELHGVISYDYNPSMIYKI